MKYKVGDVVTIITPKDRNISPVFTSAMEKFIGKNAVILEITVAGCLVMDVGWTLHVDWVVPYNKILNGVLSEGGNI